MTIHISKNRTKRTTLCQIDDYDRDDGDEFITPGMVGVEHIDDPSSCCICISEWIADTHFKNRNVRF